MNEPVVASVRALEAKNEQRIADQMVALQEGRHFWICGAVFRLSGPSEDIILDTENMAGFMGVHCAICGTETDDNPACSGY